MLARQGIQCQVLIVRGDGSLAKADYVRTRPVEIIHSGPATSTIGGQYLANVPTALVIDIGGTTTDIAFVDQGKLQIQDKAATVGPFRTCVHTIKTRSFGLGGDSRISFDRHQNLAIGPDRVIPIARLCSLFPHLKADLSHWLWEKPEMIYPDRLEYWILRREPSSPFADARTNRAIQILRDGPKRLPVLLKQAGAVSPVQIDAVELVQQDIIERAALTPTDLLHVTGEFTPWDGEAACILAKSVARIWDEDSNAFAERVRKEITARIVAEIIQFLSDKPLSEPSFNLNRNSLDRWIFDESMQPAHPSLGCSFLLKAPIVGIGAPAKSFLPLVAEALHTEIIFPEHYAVANAVGTVVGNVMAHQEGDVFPRVEGAVISGYYARAASAQRWFERYEEALEYIRALLIQQVAAEARAAGAEEVNIDCQEREVIQGMAHVSAWAIGKPGVDGNKKARPV